MDMSKIQRALGVIEGVCFSLEEPYADLISSTLADIDEQIAAGALPCNDSGSGNADAHDRMHYTTGEMDELVECLYMHHEDYGQGYAQDYHDVCLDCRNAADVITMLREQLKDREYGSYMERP